MGECHGSWYFNQRKAGGWGGAHTQHDKQLMGRGGASE